jgi:hypothetical protein
MRVDQSRESAMAGDEVWRSRLLLSACFLQNSFFKSNPTAFAAQLIARETRA